MLTTIMCVRCMGRGYVATGFNDTRICPECNELGLRRVDLQPPFSVDAISKQRRRRQRSAIPLAVGRHPNADGSQDEGHEARQRRPDDMVDWLYIVSDANGERAFAMYAPVVSV
jgi:hypothetical protein